MINHVSIGVREIPRTKRFYDDVLEPLGYRCLNQDAGSLGYGREAVAFWINAAERPVPPDDKSGLHFCFTAPTRESVNVFHAAALRSGGRDNGPPGIGSTTDLTTTLRSSSIRMGTGSKPGAGFPRLVCYERTPLQTGHTGRTTAESRRETARASDRSAGAWRVSGFAPQSSSPAKWRIRRRL
jgi:catechol 2,3-dioxygenase-like lactoylglutathione lyase family enzyme